MNPLGMPETVKQAVIGNIDKYESYPDPFNRELVREISKFCLLYTSSPDRAKEIIDQCLAHGVSKVLLFGIPKEKDEMGSQA